MLITHVTTHAEKVALVKKFLRGELEGCERKRSLILFGTGGNGKSKVIEEVAATSPVNILAVNAGDTHRFFPAATPSDECVLLLTTNVLPKDTELEETLSGYLVHFRSDPAYS